MAAWRSSRAWAFIVLWPALAAAQAPDPREAELRAAITAEPGELRHYRALAELHRRQSRPDQADAVLREALVLDPVSRPVFEERVALFVDPFRPQRIGLIGLEWLSLDGTNAVPVLLATGHRLRLASRRRGDGTDASVRELERALGDIDGAVPANPDLALLSTARAAVLRAWAMLTTDAEEQAALMADALDAQRRADDLASRPDAPLLSAGAAAKAVAAMGTIPPFGPVGAVRVGPGVPAPRNITRVLPIRRRLMPGERRIPVALELVIDPTGRVIQVHPLDSVEHYDDHLAEVVKQWLYEPPMAGGRPATVILNETVMR